MYSFFSKRSEKGYQTILHIDLRWFSIGIDYDQHYTPDERTHTKAVFKKIITFRLLFIVIVLSKYISPKDRIWKRLLEEKKIV